MIAQHKKIHSIYHSIRVDKMTNNLYEITIKVIHFLLKS